MKSWEVMRRRGKDKWGLYIRDYPCQGVNPDYILVKEIDEATAINLVLDRLAGDLYGEVDKALKETANVRKVD